MPRNTAARNEAQRVLSETKIAEPPVRLKVLVEYYVFKIKMEDWPEKYEGKLERDKRVIHVNKNHHLVKQRFTIAHEFGHYFLHRSGDYFDDGRQNSSNIQEKEANAFAAELLMPHEWVKRDYGAITNPEELARKYEVSKQAMWYRLMELNLIK